MLALQAGPPPQLAADAERAFGVEGRVVDELNEPVVDTAAVAIWALGGKAQTSVASTDQQGRFVLMYPLSYMRVRFLFPTFQDDISDRLKVVERKPLVLQVPRYRMRLQGIWKVVSWEQAGQKEKPEEFKNRELHITYNTVSVWDGDHNVSEESYRINPAVKPQKIVLTAKKQTRRTPGIFRLQGNRLTLCLNRSGRGLFPSKFASEVDSPNEYQIELERYDSIKEIKQIEGVDTPANTRVAAALREQTQLKFVNVPLSDGLEFVSDLHDIDVDLDHAILKKAGIALTTPVTIDVRSVKLHVALKILLRPLKLGYVLRDGRLMVASRQDAVARNSGFPSPPGAATDLLKSGKPAVAVEGKPLDLIQLATTYVDAVGVMELAQLKMKRLDQLAKSNVVTKLELESARLATKNAERKVALLQTIIEQEIEDTSEKRKAAEVQLKFEKRLVEKGFATQTPIASRIRQLDGRLRTLHLILKP